MFFRPCAFWSLASVCALAACRDTKPEQEHTTTATQSAVPSVTFTATDFAFEGPSRIPAGQTRLVLVNQGRELHHLQLVKLEQGKTFEDFRQAGKNPGPPPAWIKFAGGPNGAPPGGGQAEAIQRLEPGQYVVTCLIPSPDGIPHFAKGMNRALEVTNEAQASATEPTAQITVKLADFAFQMPEVIRPGRQTILVENAGPQAHELVLLKLDAGKTSADFGAWGEKMQGPPPGLPLGGVAVIDNGGRAYINVDLEPGQYGFICFVPDTKDGKPHFVHGMLRDFTVAAAAT